MEVLRHNHKLQQKLWRMTLFLLAMVAFWMVLYATVWGAGWVADSYQYIGAARTLASRGRLAYPGTGEMLIPLSHYPPAFSVVLAAFEWLGWDAYVTVRYFHAVLFGLLIILVGITVFRASTSYSAALYATLLTLFSAALLERHAWALSEPLYLVTTVGGFLLLDVFYRSNKRIFLLFSLLCFSIAWLTRYIGFVAIITVAIYLMVVSQRPWKQRILEVGLTLTLPTIPILFWAVRNFALEGQFLNRNLTFTPLGTKNWLSIIQTLAGWLLPGRIIFGREKWIVIAGAVILCFLVGWWLFRAHKGKFSPLQIFQSLPTLFLYVLYGVLYVPFVILSKLFFDPMIGFTERMLIPTQLSVIMVVSLALNSLWKTQRRLIQGVVLIVALFVLVYYGNESLSRLERLHKQGMGVASRRWHESEVIQKLPTLEGAVYSNSQSSMYLWSGKAGGYFTALSSGKGKAGEQAVYLVVFHYLKTNARFQQLLEEATLIATDEIASIYLYQTHGIGQ